MAGLMLSAGSLSDRYGRRGFLSAGLALFAITSAVAAQVDTADALIWGRAAMGVGAAVIFPATLGLITNIFTDPVPRAKAIGLWAAMVGVGVAAGPSPEAGSRKLLVGLYFPGQCADRGGGDRRRAAVRPDVAGPRGPARRRTGPGPVRDRRDRPGVHPHRGAQRRMDQLAHHRGVRVAAVVLTAFALWERRTPHPMLDVTVFANRRFSGGSLAITAGFLTLFGFIFVITQYFQFIKAYSAFETGVRLLPVAISIALGSVVGPRIVEKIGTTALSPAAWPSSPQAWAGRPPSTPAPLSRDRHADAASRWRIGPDFSPATEAIMGSLSADKAGVGSGVNDTTRELGGTLGVAIVGSVFASIYSGRLGSDSVITALPGDVRSTMERSIAAAHEVIGQLPDGMDGVRIAVDNAFLDGLQVGSLVCAAIALGAALVVAVLLPARARQSTSTATEIGPIQPKGVSA